MRGDPEILTVLIGPQSHLRVLKFVEASSVVVAGVLPQSHLRVLKLGGGTRQTTTEWLPQSHLRVLKFDGSRPAGKRRDRTSIAPAGIEIITGPGITCTGVTSIAPAGIEITLERGWNELANETSIAPAGIEIDGKPQISTMKKNLNRTCGY